MSSSRRRGRSPGSPAAGTPSPTHETQPEPVEAIETAPDESSPVETSDDVAAAAVEASAPPSEPVAEQVVPSTGDAPAAETAPEEPAQALAEPAVEAAETVAETTSDVVTETTEQTAEAASAAVEQTTDAVADAVEQTADTAVAATEQATSAAQAVVETLPSAASDETLAASKGVRVGANFVFVPTLQPLTEINQTLLAFARGEGEAAVAHFQALSRVKSPAEAIRLQVSELQRAADASLTCFSHILRSANRFGDSARWH